MTTSQASDLSPFLLDAENLIYGAQRLKDRGEIIDADSVLKEANAHSLLAIANALRITVELLTSIDQTLEGELMSMRAAQTSTIGMLSGIANQLHSISQSITDQDPSKAFATLAKIEKHLDILSDAVSNLEEPALRVRSY